MTDPGSRPDKIVISSDDLESLPPDPPPEGRFSYPPQSPQPRQAYPPPTQQQPAQIPSPHPPFGSVPPITAHGTPPGAPLPPIATPIGPPAGHNYVSTPSGGLGVTLNRNSVVAGLVAGLIGGALGMMAAEVLKNPDSVQWGMSEAEMRVDSGISIAIVGAGLGFVLAGWEGFTSGSSQKGFIDGALGALVGAAAGFVGGYAAQWIYTAMLDDLEFADSGSVENTLRVSRAVAWAIFGACLGGGLGAKQGPTKIVNGVIGGAIGGAIGGLVFQEIELMVFNDDFSSDISGWWLRFIGFTITGAGIGLGVGLVDRIRRDAWLVFIAGPMAGKELILFKPTTTVGSDYRCDVVLVKDAAVAGVHASLNRDAAGTTTTLVPSGSAVLVNGAPSGGQVLRNGDSISIGQSVLNYQERAVAPANYYR